jgi:hypothetical protein
MVPTLNRTPIFRQTFVAPLDGLLASEGVWLADGGSHRLEYESRSGSKLIDLGVWSSEIQR